MRAVTKGAPPDNVSPPGQRPMRFIDAERELHRRLDRFVPRVEANDVEERTALTHTCFDAMYKRPIREAMIAEPRGLCVYCEDRVREPERGTAPPIEHWRPLSRSHRTAIH